MFSLSRYGFFLATLAFLSAPGFASPIWIASNLTPLGNNSYRDDFSVYNNGSLPNGAAVQLFDVFFDPSLYLQSSLTVVEPTALDTQWSGIILYGTGPTDPAAFDVLALGAGIAVGQTVSDFSVIYAYLGPGTPGPLPFSVSNPPTVAQPAQPFAQIETGTTTSPEPSFKPVLFAILIAYGTWRIWWRRFQS